MVSSLFIGATTSEPDITSTATFLPANTVLILSSLSIRTISISCDISLSNRTRSSSSISRVRLSFSAPRRENTLTLITVPSFPGGTVNEVSRTSPAFSPKIAFKSFSSGERSVSPLGVTLPTSMLPVFTLAPTLIIPDSSRFFKASSETCGISRVISSFPCLVSRASTSNSSI